MYTIMFNTAAADKGKRRQDWERQLVDDFLSAMHLKMFVCKDEKELKDRLEFIVGNKSLPLANDDSNYVTLSNERYGEQKLACAMYGFAQGYVRTENILKQLEKGRGCVSIPFVQYYDLRQKNLRWKSSLARRICLLQRERCKLFVEFYSSKGL